MIIESQELLYNDFYRIRRDTTSFVNLEHMQGESDMFIW